MMGKHFVSLVFTSLLFLVEISCEENVDSKILEEHIESVQVDESNYAPGVKDVHRYVKEYRQVKKYDVPSEDQIIDLLHTIDFTKSGNNKFSKLGVLLDKFYLLTKNGISFEKIEAAIPKGGDLSEALIGVHKLTFEKRDMIKDKKVVKKAKKKDPNLVMMELMGMVLSGKTDLQFVEKVLLFLKDEPGLALSKAVDLATQLGFISKEMSKSIQENFIPIVQSDATTNYVEGFYNMTMLFFRSSSGERIIAGLPEFIQNPTAENGVKFLKKEADWNIEKFFASMANSDYKNSILNILASYISKGLGQAESLFSSSSEKGILLLNGLLLAQGIPAYNHERPIYSLGMIVNKGIKLFTTIRFDVSPYIPTLEEMFKEIKESPQWKLFFSLDEVQRVTAIQRFIDEELSEPIEDLWVMHSYMSKNNKWHCATRLICLETERAKKSGKEARQVGTSILSMCISWIWNDGGINNKFWNYYEAVWSGISLECEEKYPLKDFKDCLALPWQEEGLEGSKKKMELNFDKVEL